MKVGDLVKCIEGSCAGVDDGVGIVLQVITQPHIVDASDTSVHVQWPNEDLWYHQEDLEVVSEIW